MRKERSREIEDASTSKKSRENLAAQKVKQKEGGLVWQFDKQSGFLVYVEIAAVSKSLTEFLSILRSETAHQFQLCWLFWTEIIGSRKQQKLISSIFYFI